MNRMQLLVGIMLITLGTGFTYALAQTDTPPQRPPAISEESRFQPEPPALTPPMGSGITDYDRLTGSQQHDNNTGRASGRAESP